MVNKKRWIDNYNELDPDSQLEVAEAIVTELRDNELVFAQTEYDKEKSRIVREFFNSVKQNTKSSKELKKFADIFKRYESLSQNNRKKVINDVFEIIVKYLGIQEQQNKEKICQQEGHTFGKWKHSEWTTYETTCIDHEIIPNYPVKHENWEKTCSRCGFIKKVDSEPRELIEAREEKNKQARIKRLESELKRLKKK